MFFLQPLAGTTVSTDQNEAFFSPGSTMPPKRRRADEDEVALPFKEGNRQETTTHDIAVYEAWLRRQGVKWSGIGASSEGVVAGIGCVATSPLRKGQEVRVTI